MAILADVGVMSVVVGTGTMALVLALAARALLSAASSSAKETFDEGGWSQRSPSTTRRISSGTSENRAGSVRGFTKNSTTL